MADLGLSRWDWLLISVALSTLGSLLMWLMTESHKTIPQLQQLFHLLQNPWIVHTARLLYAIGIPAIALFWQHDLTSRGLGLRALPVSQTTDGIAENLTGFNDTTWESWILDTGWTLALTAAVGIVISLGDRIMQRHAVASEVASPQRDRRRDLGVAVREAVYHQVHWAFYREPFVIRWGLMVGSWMGALPVLLESLLNPIFWERLRARDAAYHRAQVIRWGRLAASTLIYLKTQNLWLTLLMDVLVGWLAAPAGASQMLQVNPSSE